MRSIKFDLSRPYDTAVYTALMGHQFIRNNPGATASDFFNQFVAGGNLLTQVKNQEKVEVVIHSVQ